MEQEIENIDSQNDDTEVIDSENNEVEVEEVEETQEEEYSDREKQLYARAKKAEAELKTKKVAPEPQTDSNLTTTDLLAVMNAKVHEDDMEQVEKFAKMEGTSIKSALQNPDLKVMLERRNEERNTANAANVTHTRKSSAKITDDVLVANANKGKLPEDDEGIAALVAAKRKLK